MENGSNPSTHIVSHRWITNIMLNAFDRNAIRED